jgi:xanthine dehydrogenase YagS FAD-binding subunit
VLVLPLGHFHCWLKGGDVCHAREGENQLHAIFDASPCVAVHPSDPPAALLALDAAVVLSGAGGSRTLPLADFFAVPTPDHRVEHVLRSGELVTAVRLPSATGVRSTYRKAMNRKVWAFALVGVAAAVRRDGHGRVERARLVLNGVAPIPWRAEAAERELQGRPLDEGAIGRAVEAALADAQALSKNRYKIPLASGLMRRALRGLMR